jgi:allophanate hydrolase
MYRLAELRAKANVALAAVDVMMVPTAPAAYTLAELEADPIELNSRLGTYTNFVNICDLSALSVPGGFRPDGVPTGVTLVGPAFSEAMLAGLGAALHHAAGVTLGATRAATPAPPAAPALAPDELTLFCIGAHMSGLPLNHQVLRHGGRCLGAAATAPLYRLYDLGNRPGMLRVPAEGAAIAGEIWALPAAAIGPFLAEIPPPLGFGQVRLADGSSSLGFLMEAAGAAAAPDITAHGGWRAFLAARKES